MNPRILFKKLNPLATCPRRASEHAAGFDLVSTGVKIQGNQAIVSTGLAVAFPEGYVLKVFGRSGLAFKHDVFLTNGVGIIDADYRGEILLSFSSTTLSPDEMSQLLKEGNRVAQCILEFLPNTRWIEVEDLPESIRGEGGFGSTGST